MKRTRTINGVKYACCNNPNYVKGGYVYSLSCCKYIIRMFDKNRNSWVQTGYCNTIREFHEKDI